MTGGMLAHVERQPANQRLDSWKGIAAFLDCTERTAKRWEQERGLPVHRMPGLKRGRVFAYPAELHQWLNESAPVSETVVIEEPPVEMSAPPRVPSPRAWAVLILLLLGGGLVALVAKVYSSRSGDRPTPAAQSLYLQGRYYWTKRTPESLTKAVDLFTQAIVQDPKYSKAYVGLADCYNLLREYSAMPPAEAYPRALAAARRAVELDSRSPEAHASLAFVSFYWSWDAPFAGLEFQRAITLNPSYVTARHWRATYLMVTSRLTEALAEIERAQQLDPSSSSILADKGWILFLLHRQDEAIASLKQVEASEPAFLSSHVYLSYLYLAVQNYPAYLDESRQAAQLAHDPQALAITDQATYGYARGGGTAMLASIQEAQERLYAQGLLPAYNLAETCALLGKRELALGHLETSLARREPAVVSLIGDPFLASLAGEARFMELVSRYRHAIRLE